jgi:hypothetical protein
MEDDIALRRKKLSEIRQRLSSQTMDAPFSVSQSLSSGETIAEFVTNIAISIHKKRTTKKHLKEH